MGLSACNGTAPEKGVCTAGAPATETAASDDRDRRVAGSPQPRVRYEAEVIHADQCIRRWAYRLAPAGGKPDELADIVLAGCAGPVRALVAAAAALPDEELSASTAAASSSPASMERNRLRARAAFYIVQGRVGNCRAQ